LGSKNKKLLGIITSIILHNLRNAFESKELYITKRKLFLIEEKHPIEFIYIKTNQFQNILDGTIAKCNYTKDREVLNFISYIDEKYVLYGIVNNSYYIHLTTLFYPSKKQLKNCFESMKFFNEKFEKDLEEYLN
jgi:hypothetical protein